MIVMSKLQVLIKPCSSGTCPAIYKDDDGRLIIQGDKLAPAPRQDIAVGEHEEVVEISADLLDFLRTI